MTSPVALTDTEAALIGGGAMLQTISTTAMQHNTSTLSGTAVATSNGCISASAVGFVVSAATVRAEAGNAAVVLQANVVKALNSLRLAPY
jgi:hypothetical protein